MSKTIIDTSTDSVEVSDIFRLHFQDYEDKYYVSPEQKKVANAILKCRTPDMGFLVQECTNCDHEHRMPLSCGNRHCPTCQEMAKVLWLSAREAEILPVSYVHCVITLPNKLHEIIYRNKRIMYKHLFDTAWAVIKGLCSNPKGFYYGKPGYMAILHTWTQKMGYHPHLHLIIPVGVLREGKWISNNRYFFNENTVAGAFKYKYLKELKKIFKQGILNLKGNLKYLNKRKKFNRFLKPLYNIKWIVDIGKAKGGAKGVLDYFARYAYKIAISNDRIISLKNDEVTFSYQDRKNKKKAICKISAVEFIKRFFYHILPFRFTKIRYYGFLANRVKSKNIKSIKNQLNYQQEPNCNPILDTDDYITIYEKVTGKILSTCPKCKKGKMLSTFIIKNNNMFLIKRKKIIKLLIDIEVKDSL